MRESTSQKEMVGRNEEPLPPGEQSVEVERAWLVDRESARAPEGDRDEELGEQNYPREAEGGQSRREERRDDEGQLAKRRYDHGAERHRSSREEHNSSHKEERNESFHEIRNPLETHQGQPWK